jgi:hypothetical protein
MLIDKKVPHNKKRNVGLVYEFLVRYITKHTLENNLDKVESAKKIIKETFTKNSELLKELRLFKRLNESEFSSVETALRFLDESKAKTDISYQKLDLEKSKLILEINKTLNADSEFFNQFVENYQTFATIQTVINHWTNKDFLKENHAQVHMLEDKVVAHLATPKQRRSKQELEQYYNSLKEVSTDKLVTTIMHKKFEEKYENLLDLRQKSILREYISENKPNLTKELISAREYIIGEIQDKENFKELYEHILSFEPCADDEHCKFFIGVLDIVRESKGEK